MIIRHCGTPDPYKLLVVYVCTCVLCAVLSRGDEAMRVEAISNLIDYTHLHF